MEQRNFGPNLSSNKPILAAAKAVPPPTSTCLIQLSISNGIHEVTWRRCDCPPVAAAGTIY